ncbi:MAG: hypothetical protein H7066_21645 [Cytophagaceae bacterium]|nr:hypothetical protein [Gemmatimonadaceae bacterium]
MFVWPLIAVAAILAAVWFFGVRHPGTIGGAEAIRLLLRDAHPDFALDDIALDPDHGRALASDASGAHVMLLFMMGNQVAIRVLEPGAVRAVDLSDAPDGSRRVVVHLADLGCPQIALTLAPADAPRWSSRLQRLAGRATDAIAQAPLARHRPPLIDA